MSKIAVYGQYTETREDGSTVYYRTGQGSHRHASPFCANSKRDTFTGDITVIPPTDVAGWAPCIDCCADADVTAATAAARAKTDAQCRNGGVVNPRRIYSTCRDCGKEGKVNPKTGKIRAHNPAA